VPRIIVGGGIGAGKGVVARLFAELGFTVITADLVGHAVLEPGGAAFDDVARHWPSVLVDGRIDRSLLAGVVFADIEELEALEEMTHPAIISAIGEQISGAPGLVIVEVPVPLPLGDGWHRVFVDADEELRVERAVARGGEAADIRRRVAAQVDRATWLEWADQVIINEGTLEEVEAEVEALWKSLQMAK
jgi:dephospho-CoA kinase